MSFFRRLQTLPDFFLARTLVRKMISGITDNTGIALLLPGWARGLRILVLWAFGFLLFLLIFPFLFITGLNVVALFLAVPAKECVDRRCWSGR